MQPWEKCSGYKIAISLARLFSNQYFKKKVFDGT